MSFRLGLICTFLLTFTASIFTIHTHSFADDTKKDFWLERCVNKEDAKKSNKRGLCEIVQLLSVKNEKGQNKRLVEFAVGYPQDKNTARGIFALPLGIFVEDGLEIQIDDNTPFKFKVRYCDTNGCFAYLNLNESVLNMMRKGETMTVRFKSIKPQNLEVNMSLKGFTKALKGIS